MSDTPRTDAISSPETDNRLYLSRMIDHARQLERELAEIRDALAGTDYASLPSDFPTVRMAHTIRADHDKFLQQVRDTCVRAEKAEALLALLVKATSTYVNRCPHEWYQGRCIHCDVAAKDGKPAP